MIQKITYTEYLPKLIGDQIPPYNGYDFTSDLKTTAEFATVAYGYGLSSIDSMTRIVDSKQIADMDGNCLERDFLCTAETILNSRADIVPIIQRLVQAPESITPEKIREHFTDKLFDLATRNIMKSRDFNIPTYSQLRVSYGLSAPTSFADITSNIRLQSILASIYSDVNNVDAWVFFIHLC